MEVYVMDKDIMVTEYLKIYFACHPDELPKDPQKAFDLMGKLHKKYKNIFIDDFKTKSSKFVDKFMDDKKGGYY
jgi:hypothetical protein